MTEMYLAMLFLLSLAFLIGSYWFNGRELTAPAFLFCAGFVPAIGCALLMSGAWNFSMSLNTFVVVVTGIALFVSVSTCYHVRQHSKEKNGGTYVPNNAGVPLLPVRTVPLLVMLVFQIGILFSVLASIQAWFPDSELFLAIGQYKESMTFTTANLSFGFPLKQIVNLDRAAGYLVAYLTAQELVGKRIRETVLCGANLFLVSAIGLVVGGRFLGLSYLFVTAICLLILKYRSDGLKAARILVAAGLMLCVMLLVFKALSFGRSGSIPYVDYIALYLGAPISNLNTYIESGVFAESSPIGRMTFFCWYTYFGYKFGITEWQYTFDLPFLESNGFNMGNVYTTFYSYLYDFGFIGVFVLIALMALISQAVYEKAKSSASSHADLWIIFSSYIAFQLIFSFFSNKFYEEIFTPGFFTSVIYLIVARFLLCRFNKKLLVDNCIRIKASLLKLAGRYGR